MTEIYIFGDSYGDINHCSNYKHTIRYHNILSSMHYKIKSFAVAGADFWSQYAIFDRLRDKLKGKKVIWFETDPNRISIRGQHFTSLKNIEVQLSSTSDPDQIHMLNLVKDYFIFMQRDDYCQYTQRLLVNELKQSECDLLLIPCFAQSSSANDSNQTMHSITRKENEAFGFSMVHDMFPEYIDTRMNHMCYQNHLVLAGQIISYFKTKKELDFNAFLVPDAKDFDIYFKKNI